MGFLTDSSSSSSRRMALPTAIKLMRKSKRSSTFKRLNDDDQTTNLNHYLDKQSSSDEEQLSISSSTCTDTLATSLSSDISNSERDSILTIDGSTSSSDGILIDSSSNKHIKQKKSVHFDNSLVTEVHTRPYYTIQERRTLFYTQYELYQFGRLKRTIDLIEKNRKFYGINCSYESTKKEKRQEI